MKSKRATSYEQTPTLTLPRRTGRGKKTGRLRHLAFDLAKLRRGVKPFRLHWFSHLRSTNDHAATLRRQDKLFAPAVVLTSRQTAGRGRGDNQWWSSAGVLTVTFIFPQSDRLAPHQIPLLAGLAVRNAVAPMVPRATVRLKWPNDLLIDGRKLGGLLCERVHKADLIGVGLNVDHQHATIPAVLQRRICSLAEFSDEPMDMTDTLIAVAKSMYEMLTHQNERSFANWLREYDSHHALAGKRVSVLSNDGQAPLTGICQRLDSMGRLVLSDRGHIPRIIAGEVRLH
jgi:BirA family biotin operon repressor/biotin-[acetyl-CoA-carboxylase] ligase